LDLIAPIASGEIFINEDELYPFSIEYPSDWEIVSTKQVTGAE
jgi:hypothetical protein